MRQLPPIPHHRAPRGLSFPILEHMAIRAWANDHNLRVVTEIDRVVGGEEYEEVLALYEHEGAWRKLTMWRTSAAIVLEPTLGQSRQCTTVWEAIEAAGRYLGITAPSQDS